MESPPVSPSSPTASDGSSLRNFLKTNHPEPLLSFSSETLADNAGSISPDHLIPPTGQFPYYRGSGTFLETISAHMRSRPTQAISQSTQRRYAQAILAAMPVDGRDPDWAKGINGAAGGLWEAGGRMFAEEEFSMQLRQHSEMFSYLSRLYEKSLGQPKQSRRAELIVRRGGEILAAVRLLAGQPRLGSYYPAGGTEARNPSRVTVWGWPWKPHREEALAERVSERRRLRAAEARAKARDEKTLSRRGPPEAWIQRYSVGEDARSLRSAVSRPDSEGTRGNSEVTRGNSEVTRGNSEVTRGNSEGTRDNSEGTRGNSEGTRGNVQLSWAEQELENSRKRREKSVERLTKKSLTVAADMASQKQFFGGDASVSSPENPRPPVMEFPRRRRREIINWHIPDYNVGYYIPSLKLSSPLEAVDKYTTAIVYSAGDPFLRSHTIKEASNFISPYHRLYPLSVPVSPKSQPNPFPYGTHQSTPEEPSVYPTTSSSTQLPPLMELSPVITTSPPLSRGRFSRNNSVGSKSLKLKMRAAIKTVFPRVTGMPWSSDSQTSYSISAKASTSYVSPTPDPPPTRKPRRIFSTPWTSKNGTTQALKTPADTKKAVSVIELLSNRTTTLERVTPPAPPPPMTQPAPPPGEEEKLTRTEREYQKLLEELQTLKRDMRLEREAARSEGRRSKSRGRRMERGRRSRSRSSSRGTTRWWLDELA